jgi:predicted RNA-binding protein with PUA-like domain
MAYWLLKTEPAAYSYDDLAREGVTSWDGVANTVALKHMRAMAVGDQALIYHTGDERRAVGLAEVTSAPYPDPRQSDSKLVVVDVRATGALPNPISLATIKAEPFFADFALVRQSRLSVVPINAEQWARLLAMAGV